MKKLIVFLLFLVPTILLAQSGDYTIVFLNSKPDAEKIDKATETKLFQGHMDNINRLAKEGKLLAAGPFHGGGGIFILSTGSTDVAQQWIQSDPAVRANRWNIEIMNYSPRIGSLCPATEPYEMVSYTFVRFNAVVEKFTAASFPNLIRSHDAFVKQIAHSADVVTEAVFGPNEGGILIVKQELSPADFSEDPAVKEGLVDVQVKKLYIAKTSFCER